MMQTPPLNPIVDCNFPGGNIVVEDIGQETILVHQDLRDTAGDWFYWCFRVRNAQAKRLTFRFTTSRAIGVRGPAISRDHGETWAWLGAECVDGNSFTHCFPDDASDVRFSFGMPYQESRLRRFLAAHADNPLLQVDTLCKTRAGRNTELLKLASPDRESTSRILLTSRHHCCEMMATYVLEGIIEAVLDRSDAGAWLSDNAEFIVVPFMDKDGVEDGDQGKNRQPHDHNRDYGAESIYPSVRGLRARVQEWTPDGPDVCLDLHCPGIHGEFAEKIYIVGSAVPHIWAEQLRFGKILESARKGPLPFASADSLPFGEAWNTPKNYKEGKSCSGWAADLQGIRLATTIEVPYANARDTEVNQVTAKSFGTDVVRALSLYLESGGARS